ncbi:hypothetical protein [Thermaurantiacus sp.]
MAEEVPARSGQALRLYQIVGILALGWAAGRLPDLLADRDAEEARLRTLLGVRDAAGPAVGGAPVAAGTVANAITPQDVAAIASEVASQVAAETVGRLVAAGWGPGGQPRQVAHGRATAAPETVVRIVHESGRPAAARDSDTAWSLAPMGAPPPSPAPAAPPATAAAEPAKAPAAAREREEAFRLASSGYEALRAGDRRGAAERLAGAVALDPEAPQASAWAADLKALRRRLSLGFYALARDGAQGDAVAAAPVLGSSQTGAHIGWTLDPLAKQRITAFARVATGSDARGQIDPETTEAAIGIRVDPFPRLPVHAAIERRFGLGQFGRDDWSARIAGGTSVKIKVRSRPVDLSVYGEGGLIGFEETDFYAGAEGKATTPLITLDRFRLEAGAGAWAGGQQGFITSHRFDLGPLLRMGFGNAPVAAQLDYRVKVAGNAEPGSGLALTIISDF